METFSEAAAQEKTAQFAEDKHAKKTDYYIHVLWLNETLFG